MKIKHILAIFNLSILISGFNLLDRYYISNDINIHITSCPEYIDCVPIIFEANNVLQVPGSYINIKWHFDDNDILNTKSDNKNKIIFRQISNFGKTEFKVQNGRILKFNMFINYSNLSTETLYNIILHELGHVYLLGHSEFKDSIMGYKLSMLNDRVLPATNKLQLSQDDCNGLYTKLIKDIKHKDYTYAMYLRQMKNIYCPTLSHNFILEDPNKIVQSEISKTNLYSQRGYSVNKHTPSRILDTSRIKHTPKIQNKKRFVRNSFKHNKKEKYTP
jgi:hypothetical protein